MKIFKRHPELIVPGAAEHAEEMETRSKELGHVLLEAYFKGTDPVNGNALSPDLLGAIAPFAHQRMMEQINESVENLRIR